MAGDLFGLRLVENKILIVWLPFGENYQGNFWSESNYNVIKSHLEHEFDEEFFLYKKAKFTKGFFFN